MRNKTNQISVAAFVPILVLFGYVVLAFEVFSYPGFMRHIFGLTAKYVAVLIWLIYAGYVLTSFLLKKTQSAELSLFQVLNRWSTLPLMFVYFVFYTIESRHYPNYVFSNYHLHLSMLAAMCLYSIGISLVPLMEFIPSSIQNRLRSSLKADPWTTIGYLAMFCLSGVLMVQSLLSVLPGTIISYSIILRHLDWSENQKIAYQVPISNFLQFVVEHTPESAIIAVPPQDNPWLTIGNAGYVRYFLYPRKVVNGNLDWSIPNEATHVVIARGTWLTPDPNRYGWPKQKINARRVWFYLWDTKTFVLSELTSYDPAQKSAYQSEWGLIER